MVSLINHFNQPGLCSSLVNSTLTLVQGTVVSLINHFNQPGLCASLVNSTLTLVQGTVFRLINHFNQSGLCVSLVNSILTWVQGTVLDLGYRSQVWSPYTLLNTIDLCTSPLLLYEVSSKEQVPF